MRFNIIKELFKEHNIPYKENENTLEIEGVDVSYTFYFDEEEELYKVVDEQEVEVICNSIFIIDSEEPIITLYLKGIGVGVIYF